MFTLIPHHSEQEMATPASDDFDDEENVIAEMCATIDNLRPKFGRQHSPYPTMLIRDSYGRRAGGPRSPTSISLERGLNRPR